MGLQAAKVARAARIVSDLLMFFLAANASRAVISSAVDRTAMTGIGSAPRPGRPRPRCFSASTSNPASASSAHCWIRSPLTIRSSDNENGCGFRAGTMAMKPLSRPLPGSCPVPERGSAVQSHFFYVPLGCSTPVRATRRYSGGVWERSNSMIRSSLAFALTSSSECLANVSVCSP